MQKLVSIYLENMAYARGKMVVGSLADKHGLIEEHLQQYLTTGVDYQFHSQFRRR